MTWSNGNFDIFIEQENEYKLTILYLLKNVNQDIKKSILNLVDINLEKEMNYIDYFEEMFSPYCRISYPQVYIDWFYDPDWYRPDIDGTLSYNRLLKNTYYPPWAILKWSDWSEEFY